MFRFVKAQPRRVKKDVDLGPETEQKDHIRDYKQNKMLKHTNLINKVTEKYVNNMTKTKDIKADKRHTSLHMSQDWVLKRALAKSKKLEK